jgi:hypothetical protein
LDAGKICVNVRGGMIFQDHRQTFKKYSYRGTIPFHKMKLAESLGDFTTAKRIFK